MEADHVFSESNNDFVDLLDVIGDASKLNVVVGAGASKDAGLPTWPELLRTVLEDGFDAHLKALPHGRRGLPNGLSYEELASAVLDSSSASVAATVARTLHGKARDDAIWRALYSDHEYAVAPGRVAIEIARLAHTFDGKCRVLTTNYDELLELALEDFAPGNSSISPKPVGIDSGLKGLARKGRVYVQHVHGFLPASEERFGKKIGPIVLDERDYALSGGNAVSVLEAMLETGDPTLFVGLSMNDPNLVHALYRCWTGRARSGRPPWYGVFVSETSSARQDDVSAAASAQLKLAARARLRDMGLKTLSLISYGQISQLLHELRLRRYRGDDYWAADDGRYGVRLMCWRDDIVKRWPADSATKFTDTHGRIHALLNAALEGLCARDGLLRGKQPRERLALEVWARCPAANGLGGLEMWGSTREQFRESWSLEDTRHEITASSSDPVTAAVFYGTCVMRNLAQTPETRWQSAVAIPIEVSDPPYYTLTVGAVAIRSTEPINRSIIETRATRRSRSEAADELKRALMLTGQQILNPAAD